MTINPRVLAFYLPQFHPIPENDRWWGAGFTEWTNVRRARPLFEGHVQPVKPGELGYYDLRSPEVRRAQADLAKAHGVTGFCYYHYWFGGRRLLGEVLDQVLASGEPQMPFCLCWANESWTRTWDGLDRNVLLQQTYGAEDDRRHMRWLTPVFSDRRYVRIEGRPVFLVYRASQLPNAAMTAMRWREEAQRAGLDDLYLCTVESLPADRLDPSRIGFDAAVEFQPDWTELGAPAAIAEGDSYVFDYEAVVSRALAKPRASYLRFPCVMPGWDNSPRRQRDAVILTGSTPHSYGEWLRTAIDRTVAPSPEENLVFINAWNEWAEGAVLEPSAKWGRAYLETTRDVVKRTSLRFSSPSVRPAKGRGQKLTVAIPTCNGAPHVEEALRSVLSQSWEDFDLVVSDDNSSDDTLERVGHVRDPRIRVVQSPVRRGLVANWNRCLAESTGEYVYIFHQDDVMSQDNLARKVATLDAHPRVGFVHSNVRQIDADGRTLSEWWIAEPSPADAGVHSGRSFLERLFFGPNPVCCPSVMMRREIAAVARGFDHRLPFTADWEMWMRLCLSHDVAYIPETLVSYRRHPAAETERFSGARGLEQSFMAKHILLSRADGLVPEDMWRSRLTTQLEDEALVLATAALANRALDQMQALLAVALGVRAEDPSCPPDGALDWMSTVLTRLLGDVPADDGGGAHHGLDQERDALRCECRNLEAEILALRGSGSWRITAPLRLLFRLLTGRSA